MCVGDLFTDCPASRLFRPESVSCHQFPLSHLSLINHFELLKENVSDVCLPHNELLTVLRNDELPSGDQSLSGTVSGQIRC